MVLPVDTTACGLAGKTLVIPPNYAEAFNNRGKSVNRGQPH
jgi:hypothetical protein